jgi:hypothetical protein
MAPRATAIALVIALATAVTAAETSWRPPAPRESHDETDDATEGYGKTPPPSVVRRALEGLRHFNRHRGREAVEDNAPPEPKPTDLP